MAKQIFIAENAGFCFGVKRAVEIAEKNQGSNTLGPLIHNPQVVDKLKEQKIIPIETLEQASSRKIIIRAHGAPDSVHEKAKSINFEVIDATCPLVKKVYTLAKELENDGYQVIIIGDKKHPEVIGISGNLNSPIIINSLDQAVSLGKYKKLGIVSQTTQSRDFFDLVTEHLKTHCDELKIHNTICEATEQRQLSAKKLAEQVNIMVVIGGKNSANTKKLFNISNSFCNAMHIETKDEITEEMLQNADKIGITAGASTPDWIIQEIINKIKSFEE